MNYSKVNYVEKQETVLKSPTKWWPPIEIICLEAEGCIKASNQAVHAATPSGMRSMKVESCVECLHYHDCHSYYGGSCCKMVQL